MLKITLTLFLRKIPMKIFIPILFLLCNFILPAQQYKTDSLLQIANSTDSNAVNALNLLSRQYMNTNSYEKGIEYSEKAKALAEKINFRKGLAAALNNIGIIFMYQGNYEKAMENYSSALKIDEAMHDRQGEAKCLGNMGMIYNNQGNYEKALQAQLGSLKIKEEIGDKKGAAHSYNNIGTIYLNQNNFEKALEQHQKALKLRQEIADKLGIANSYNNIGNDYSSIGNISTDKKSVEENYSKALENHQLSLKLMEELGDKKGIANSYGNIGLVYEKRAENLLKEKKPGSDSLLERSLESFLKCLSISEIMGDKLNRLQAYNNIGTIYSLQGKTEQALSYLDRSLQLAKEAGFKSGIRDAYYELANVYRNKQDYKNAFDLFTLYSDTKDSLLNESNSKIIAEMNTK